MCLASRVTHRSIFSLLVARAGMAQPLASAESRFTCHSERSEESLFHWLLGRAGSEERFFASLRMTGNLRQVTNSAQRITRAARQCKTGGSLCMRQGADTWRRPVYRLPPTIYPLHSPRHATLATPAWTSRSLRTRSAMCSAQSPKARIRSHGLPESPKRSSTPSISKRNGCS